MRWILVVFAFLLAFAGSPASADDGVPSSPSACSWVRDFRTGEWQCRTCYQFAGLRWRCTEPQEVTPDGRCRISRFGLPDPQEVVLSPSARKAEVIGRCDTGGERWNALHALAIHMTQLATAAGVEAPYLADLDLELEDAVTKIMITLQSRQEWSVTYLIYYFRLFSVPNYEYVLPSGVILSIGFHTWEPGNGYPDPKHVFLILTSPDYKFQVRATGIRTPF